MIGIAGLTKGFGRKSVLEGVDLDIVTGERVALVGANGAGKTTLVRCLLGEYAHGGSALIGGASAREQRREVLSRVGFVPQTPPPLPHPVGVLIGFAASICRCEPRDIQAVATRLGMDARDVWRQPFVKLSGGQKQKLLIAIALGRQTEVQIMDEPAANLDPDARRVFFELLAERSEGQTMLLSSHRLDEVSGLVNRVVEIDSGRVSLDSPLADAVSLSTLLSCELRLRRNERTIALTLENWGLRDQGDGLYFKGRIAGPDRLRFMGMLSRYSGLVANLVLREEPGQEDGG
ncbi:MAG: ATP-binding cassette domain-containing protein [bacterium]|nr:ATP-binding cassette domain-containing protein [bacterium]